MKIKEILEVTGGRLLSGDVASEIAVDTIFDDTRRIGPGQTFIALKGANYNGDDFVRDAFKKGASGAIVSRGFAGGPIEGRIIIKVNDTVKALQDIASAHRSKFNIPVIGVTGSNGKTTVKEMIWKILSEKYSVLKNEGTRNNHIGLPETILKMNRGHDVCVLELGANHKGEIKLLTGIARPRIAVITNIGPSHLEYFGSLEGVLEAKKEILGCFSKQRPIAILNGDDRYLSAIKRNGQKVIRFGFGGSNDFSAGAITIKKGRIRFIVNGRHEFILNLLGSHNIYNALAAIAVSSLFKIPYNVMSRALKHYKPTYMRLDVKVVKGISVINDAYNSNPASMLRALEAVRCYPAKSRWVVAGDMLELGSRGVSFHKEIGSEIGKSGIDGLLTFGKLSKHTFLAAAKNALSCPKTWHCTSHAQIATILKKNTSPGDVILLKGSRSMRMEEVLDKLNS